MSVLKYKDPDTGKWVTAPSVKVITEYAGGSAVGVPADIIAEADRVTNSISSKMGSNSLTFIAMADMHEMGDGDHSDATIIERYRRANCNAGQGAKLIAEKISMDFFANLGDLAWGSSDTTLHDWAQSVVKARGYTAGIEPLTECFFTPGNHDVDYVSGYRNENLVVGMIGTYRYVDLTAKKVRIICLNTADTTDGTDSTERVSGEQLQWFAESLDLSSKSDAAEWSIVVLSHHPLDWSTATTPLVDCISAYLNGITYSATHDGVSVSYDYTGKNIATFIANFHGHVHCFMTAKISGTEALRVAIPNACYGRNNEYGTIGNTEFGETTTYNKNDNGTGKNTAFCVVSVDLDRKIIYADCFGAGYDRVISYGGEDIVIYSVTNNLTNATNSNGTATIAEGSSYCATITVNSGYELDAITVTMGGVDVTATAVNGSNIIIAKVTGNIVITATTIVRDDFEYGEFTNLVHTAKAMDSTDVYNSIGYKDGYRLSSSSPFESAASGYVITGYIPYTMVKEKLPGTVYIKGAIWDEVSNCRMYFFTAAKTAICGPLIQGGTTGNAALSSSYTVEQLDADYFRLVPAVVGSGKWAAQNIAASVSDMSFFRISLAGSGANLIITVDEPIHKES